MSDIPHLDGQKLVHIDPACLKPYPNNPRTHSKEQVRKIAASIERFGFRNPILIDQEMNVVAGHGRLQAAASLGLRRFRRCCSQISPRPNGGPISLPITGLPNVPAGTMSGWLRSWLRLPRSTAISTSR